METVLIVEDETAMRRYLADTLITANFRVAEATTTVLGEKLAIDLKPAAMLLDLGLPDGDGLTLLRRLRSWSSMPVIVLSARHREDDKILALDAGADDYLVKPFGTGELLARLRVALRHANKATFTNDPVLQAGPFKIDQTRHEVSIDGTQLHLTPIEFKLLVVLARHAGKVLTHDQMLREVWGPMNQHQTHHLRVHMAALRRKIERDSRRPRWLTTEAGVGYRLRDE